MIRLALLVLLATPALAHPGIGIVMDSHGNVYYTDLTQVWKVTPNGQKTIAVPRVHTHELYVDDQDNLYGEHLWFNGERLNTWGHYVWKYSANGLFEKIMPDRAGFSTDFSFVHDHAGNRYRADRDRECQTIYRTSRRGPEELHTRECFGKIGWLSITREGDLIFMQDQHRLRKMDKSGKSKSVGFIASKGTMGLWDDAAGNIYTATYDDRTVRRFTSKGEMQEVYTTNWPWAPTGGLAAPNGDLWLLETNPQNEVRVERISKNGVTTIIQ
ncbi:MAG: hypothetical protein JNL17_04270 [Cyclobacteriaceae bacterium]|nr:hypothetical protein [Cyclobacteriaceae bacterium]